MSDYWVSRDKYFCKYCKIYIADDKPSRTHHETGLRHKGNYERYIRDMYKKGITERKEAKEEKAEIARIEAAAAAAMGIEAPEPSTSSSSSAAAKPKPAASSDPYANYTTAANLGIKDEAAEKLKEEQAKREKEGVIGEWQRVVKPRQAYVPPAAATVPTGGFVSEAKGKVKAEDGGEDVKPNLVGNLAPPIPPAASAEDAAEHPYDLLSSKKRTFLTEKTAASLYDDEDDMPIAPIKLKKQRLTVKEQTALDAAAAEERQRKEEAEREAERRGAARGGGWAAADVAEDEGFDPLAGLAPVPAVAEGGGGEGTAEEKQEDKPAVVEEKKPALGGGFKKRKMHGAGAARKK
ncbi:hypothetical protein JCM8097_000871 [Rhodosporidiobolus ruineniae]